MLNKQSITENKREIVIICNIHGRIISVLRASHEFANTDLRSENILILCDSYGHPKLESFLTEIKTKGVALSWEIDFKINNLNYLMNAFGLLRDELIFIMASDTPGNILNLYDELLLIVNEQNVEIRQLKQKEHTVAPSVTGDQAALDDFMKLNNELVNLQREMALVNQRIASQERRYRKFIQKSPDMMFVIDSQNAVIYENEVGQDFIANKSDCLAQPFCLAFDTSSEGELLIKNGNEITAIELRRTKIDFDEKNVHLINLRDVSERRKLEVLREDIDRISKHDLKGPLNAIINIPQIMLDDNNLNDDQRDMLNAVTESGNRMLKIINLSLGLYQMESGTYELNPTPVNLFDLTKKVQSELQSIANGFNVAIDISEEVNSTTITQFIAKGDELLCHCLLTNLLKNAIEASPAGSTVKVLFKNKSPYEITIKNEGEVPHPIRSMFFEKYATYGKKSGTGLGTYSAKLMADSMGGNICLDCSQSGCTLVKIQLPCFC